jgi:hypothetical protein
MILIGGRMEIQVTMTIMDIMLLIKEVYWTMRQTETRMGHL